MTDFLTALAGALTLICLAGATRTTVDLLHSFHDDQAARLVPDLFRWLVGVAIFAMLALVVRRRVLNPALTWMAWLVGAAVSLGVVVWGLYLLARPADLGSYEAYCLPLLLESVPGAKNAERCSDVSQLVAGLGLVLAGGVGAWVTLSRANQISASWENAASTIG